MNVIVLGRCAPEKQSSFGKFEYEQAELLAKKGHKVIYCYADNRSVKLLRRFGLRRNQEGLVEQLGICLPIGGIPWHIFQTIKTKCLIWLLDELSDNGFIPDIIYAHFPVMTLTNSFLEAMERKRIPIACMEHWTKVQRNALDDNQRKLLRSIVKRCSAFACVSDDLADAVSSITTCNRKHIQVIPNVVDGSIFYPKRNKERGEGELNYVWAGRIERNKSVDVILEALRRIEYSYHLYIVGCGSDEARLKKLASELGISEHINFVGWKSPKELGDLYRQCDCLISASSDETFCVPFAEAWMCGLFCVGVSTNPLRREFKDWNGGLFKKGDSDSLVMQLLSIPEKMKILNIEKIATWAKSTFSEKEVIEKIELFLETAIECGLD